MNKKYIMDKDGNPVICESLTEWAEAMEIGNRRIAEDLLPNGVSVSTVFLSIDHAFNGGLPVLFETMIFGGPHDQWQDRYHTKDEAVAGHRRVVACLTAGESPDHA